VILPQFSVGVGDRFEHQAKAQLSACLLAALEGVEVVPVWNKSNREHLIIGSELDETRKAAYVAVRELGWDAPYLSTLIIQTRIQSADISFPAIFSRWMWQIESESPADPQDLARFIQSHPARVGAVSISNIELAFKTDRHFVEDVANKFLAAVKHAGEIYRFLSGEKGEGQFVTEISMDETDAPQTR
jgi:tagaturonate epimerase